MPLAGWVLALAAVAAEPTAAPSTSPRLEHPASGAARGQRPKPHGPDPRPSSATEQFTALAGECAPLPRPLSGPPPFPAGELLRYDIDVVGVRAGRMSFEVLQGAKGAAETSVRVRAESNTFFDKFRKVKAEAVANLRARDLHPSTFREDLSEGGVNRIAKVAFPPPGGKQVELEWRTATTVTLSRHGVVGDALDYVSAMYLFRALPLKVGAPFCFDAYAMKRMWRVVGKVEAREHLSTPVGEFQAFHLRGVATRAGSGPLASRQVHIWISDDAQRLPLAAVGVIDLGPVRATLSGVQRPDFKTEIAPDKPLEW
jgi:hypothetical protein